MRLKGDWRDGKKKVYLMKKVLIFSILFVCSTNYYAQNSFSCSYRNYCTWNEISKKFENCEGYEESSLFSINKLETMITHTTETIKSIYYVNSKKISKDGQYRVYDVTSDIGNSYKYIFDVNMNKIKALYNIDDMIKMVEFDIKANFDKSKHEIPDAFIDSLLELDLLNGNLNLPNSVRIGIDKIKNYYKCFENINILNSNLHSFYNPIVIDYYGRSYINSFEAKERDIENYKSNGALSINYSIDDSNIKYEEYEYYYLYKISYDCTIYTADNKTLNNKHVVYIALAKDEYKILAIGVDLDTQKLNRLITDEVITNIDQNLYYKRNVNDPNVVSIRNLIDDHNSKSYGKRVLLDADIGSMMSEFSSDYFIGKFMLLNIEDAKYGGKWATIIFLDKPDKAFFVWVYKGRIKGFGDAGLPTNLLLTIQNGLSTFNRNYGF